MKERMPATQSKHANQLVNCLTNTIHSGVFFGGERLFGPSRANRMAASPLLRPCTSNHQLILMGITGDMGCHTVFSLVCRRLSSSSSEIMCSSITSSPVRSAAEGFSCFLPFSCLPGGADDAASIGSMMSGGSLQIVSRKRRLNRSIDRFGAHFGSQTAREGRFHSDRRVAPSLPIVTLLSFGQLARPRPQLVPSTATFCVFVAWSKDGNHGSTPPHSSARDPCRTMLYSPLLLGLAWGITVICAEAVLALIDTLPSWLKAVFRQEEMFFEGWIGES
jgi:hypothetical protein